MTGPVVACKDGVRFGGFTPALCRILTAVVAVAGKRGEVLTITSGSDGRHSLKPLSRHYTFEAVDLRTKHLPDSASKRELQLQLQVELGPQFTVLLENEGRAQEHLHLQPRMGHQYEAEAAA